MSVIDFESFVMQRSAQEKGKALANFLRENSTPEAISGHPNLEEAMIQIFREQAKFRLRYNQKNDPGN